MPILIWRRHLKIRKVQEIGSIAIIGLLQLKIVNYV